MQTFNKCDDRPTCLKSIKRSFMSGQNQTSQQEFFEQLFHLKMNYGKKNCGAEKRIEQLRQQGD